MSQWSFQIRIDEETKDVSIEFTPQHLSPAEYGVVLAVLIAHLVRCFGESNPGTPAEAILTDLLDGIKAGLEHQTHLPSILSH